MQGGKGGAGLVDGLHKLQERQRAPARVHHVQHRVQLRRHLLPPPARRERGGVAGRIPRRSAGHRPARISGQTSRAGRGTRSARALRCPAPRAHLDARIRRRYPPPPPRFPPLAEDGRGIRPACGRSSQRPRPPPPMLAAHHPCAGARRRRARPRTATSDALRPSRRGPLAWPKAVLSMCCTFSLVKDSSSWPSLFTILTARKPDTPGECVTGAPRPTGRAQRRGRAEGSRGRRGGGRPAAPMWRKAFLMSAGLVHLLARLL